VTPASLMRPRSRRPSGRTASSASWRHAPQSAARARASAVRQVRRDARLRGTCDSRSTRAAPRPPRPIDTLKERRLRIFARTVREIRIQVGRGQIMGRDGMPLPPFSWRRSHHRFPCGKQSWRRISTRCSRGEAVDHHAQEGAIAQPHDRAGGDAVDHPLNRLSEYTN
jgi:hypothetical protein